MDQPRYARRAAARVSRCGRLAAVLVGLTSVLVTLVVAAASRAEPAGAAEQLGEGAGFTLLFDRPTALPAPGWQVYVNKRTPHAAWVASAVRNVVQQQRRPGVALTWRGYTNALGANRAEIVEYGDPGCAHGALAVTHLAAYIKGNYAMLAHSEVHLCAISFRYGNAVLLGTLLHEMGHSVGLGHFTGEYRGHRQVMSPELDVGRPLATYQLGDNHGLHDVAIWTSRFASEFAPSGHIDSAIPQANGSYAVSGWTLPGRESSDGGRWALSEDGRTVASGNSTINRADVDHAMHVDEASAFTATTAALPGQTHLWCVSAVDPASPIQPTRILWCAHLTGPKLVGQLESVQITAQPGVLSAGQAHITGTALTLHDTTAPATVLVTMENSSLQAALWIELHGSTVATIAVSTRHRFDNTIPIPVAGATYCFTARNGSQTTNLTCRTLGTARGLSR